MKIIIVRILSLIVIIAGIMVIIGWIFDIAIFKSISPMWISMKFDTAIAFVLSGITLYFIDSVVKGKFDLAQVVISITTLIIILLMGVLFFSALFRIHTGVEDLFVKESPGMVKTVTPGMPSIPTMFNFLLISLAGILTILKSKKLQLKLKIIGIFISIIGALALVGYIINVPLFYYYIKDINSAMAFHTATLFVISGIGLLCL